jgi:hypothetical protein
MSEARCRDCGWVGHTRDCNEIESGSLWDNNTFGEPFVCFYCPIDNCGSSDLVPLDYVDRRELEKELAELKNQRPVVLVELSKADEKLLAARGRLVQYAMCLHGRADNPYGDDPDNDRMAHDLSMITNVKETPDEQPRSM